MSALIALSSMHRSFGQEADLRDRLQANAIHRYNKAIRDISHASEDELPVDAILMTVIVFHSLDSLRGCYQRALQHAQSGVKIISERLLSRGSHQPSSMDEALYRDFLALQNQIREYGNLNTSRVFDALKGFDPPPKDRFGSVEEAAHQFDIVYNEISCLNDHCQALQESGVVLPGVFSNKIQPRFERISVRFGRWVLGMDRLGALLDGQGDDRQKRAFRVLMMYKSLFTAIINNFPTAACFDQFDEDLATALDLAEIVVNGHGDGSESQTTFTLSLGVIPALFMIAWRSNDDTIRDKSLRLLERANRREGVWDSAVALKLAQRYIALNKQLASVDGYTSDSIQLSELRFDSEAICEMTCVFVGAGNPPGGTLMPFEGTTGERRHVEIIHFGTS
ncbi:hypothetical protein H2200_011304 [Cladophialophora chaetospira]|uniref:Uncharacterized protein n=1 Tax=Cladophialophora chaetospira TaxID=386627 RepID=A0AA38X0F7_9EURO|nr:hypothetical protein H2200_011304 [Cladophialophora chaetospira]